MTTAFFTEMGFQGTIPRTHPNMRTEFAWMCKLGAYHYNLTATPSKNYDLGIVINSKKNPELVNVGKLKKYCKEVAIMQEGPFWYFQDYPLANQIHYYNNLTKADIILAHNEQDREYYQGLVNHPNVKVLQSLLIPDSISDITEQSNRKGIMIGGNFVSWYGGFDSYIIANSVTDDIYSPKMGRAIEGEEQLGIKQLPYLKWNEWMTELSKCKIGVHLMRTHAAGTFALNCSFLGIPCIGYEGLDTQRKLHPNLTVKDGDLNTARNLIEKLWNDLDFYQENAILTKELYKKLYNEDKFYTTWKEQFKIS